MLTNDTCGGILWKKMQFMMRMKLANKKSEGNIMIQSEIQLKKQKTLSNWLKSVVIGMGILGAIVYGYVLPMCWQNATVNHTSLGGTAYWIRMGFLWITAIPCYIALVYAWKVFTEIGNNNSFSFVNAKYLKNVAILALVDTVYYFVGNMVMFFANMNHPGVLLISFLICFVGAAVVIVCAALYQLVQKAAELKEENELTI